MSSLKLLVPVLLLLALFACAKPPQADIDAARTAVAAAAKNPDIVAYAPEALKSAQDKLAQMDSELAAKHYDKVKTLAVDAKATSEAAVSDAARNKEKTQADARTLIDALKKAIPAAEKKVSAARNVRRIRLDFDALATQLADAKAAVADADRDFASGNFAAALQKAIAVQTQLNDGERAVSDAVQAAAGKKK